MYGISFATSTIDNNKTYNSDKMTGKLLFRITSVQQGFRTTTLILFLLAGYCLTNSATVFSQTIPCNPTDTASTRVAVTGSFANPVGITIIRQNSAETGIDVSESTQTMSATATNSGTVVTCGGVSEYNDEQGNPASAYAFGVRAIATSSKGIATVVNENSGIIETRGRASKGLAAFTSGDGTASATNHGSILTTGDTYFRGMRENFVNDTLASDGIFVNALGNGNAEATNEAGARIATRGSGARGMTAVASNDPMENDPEPQFVSTGDATAINRGTVTTYGSAHIRIEESDLFLREANGIHANTISGDATVINEGKVETHGITSDGLHAQSDSGDAIAINRGRIITTNEFPRMRPRWHTTLSSHGIYAWSETGHVSAVNEAEATIQTSGVRAYGIFAGFFGDDSESKQTAEAMNRGTITTRGHDADAVVAFTLNGGTARNPNTAYAVNEKGGTIVGSGNRTYGVASWLLESRDGHGYGRVIAENHGSITLSGKTLAIEHYWGVVGVQATQEHLTNDDPRGHTGDTIARNTGDIFVTGNRANAISAESYGNGLSVVEITGGTVVAGKAGENNGVAIQTAVQTAAAEDLSDDIDIDVLISGKNTTVTAHSAASDDPETPYRDDIGIGILATINSGETLPEDTSGHIRARITDGATLTAKHAAIFDGGRTSFEIIESTVNGFVWLTSFADVVTLQGSYVSGNIDMDDGDDTFTIKNRGYVTGDIQFGDGTDSLVLDVTGINEQASSIDGSIMGLETMIKRGTGQVRINNAGMDSGKVQIENGSLIVTGHLDLGNTGEVTIHDDSKLVFEIGNFIVDSNLQGKITAGGGVKFIDNSKPEISLQLAASMNDDVANVVQSQLRQGVSVLGDNTSFKKSASTGSDADTNTVVKSIGGGIVGSATATGLVSITSDVPSGAEISSETGLTAADSSSNNQGYYVAGALIAWLLSRPCEDNMESDNQEFRSAWNCFNSYDSLHTINYDQNQRFYLSVESDPSSASAHSHSQGLQFGLNYDLGKQTEFSLKFAPNTSGSVQSENLSLNDYSHSTGNYYAVNADWSNGYWFAKGSANQGNYETTTRFIGSTAQISKYSGTFNSTHNHLQLTLGASLSFNESMLFVPSISVFRGTIRNAKFRARNHVFAAQLPAFSQRYEGWQLGFRLKTSDGLRSSDRRKWYPHVSYDVLQLQSDEPGELALRQSDFAGVVSFKNQLTVRKLPRLVHGFRAGIASMLSSSTQLKLEYATAKVESDFQHGALLQIKIIF